MGEVVIVAYRPKPGREGDLLELVWEHAPFLRRLGLATDRPATILQARDGVIVEVFEWESGVIAAAHENPQVQALWARFSDACDYTPLAELAEAKDLFAQFRPIDP